MENHCNKRSKRLAIVCLTDRSCKKASLRQSIMGEVFKLLSVVLGNSSV